MARIFSLTEFRDPDFSIEGGLGEGARHELTVSRFPFLAICIPSRAKTHYPKQLIIPSYANGAITITIPTITSTVPNSVSMWSLSLGNPRSYTSFPLARSVADGCCHYAHPARRERPRLSPLTGTLLEERSQLHIECHSCVPQRYNSGIALA